MLEFLLIGCLIFLSVYCAIQWIIRSSRKVLRGPKGWPVIGVLFEFDLLTLHFKLFEWTIIYGDFFEFELLGKKFVSLNSSEIVRETFNKEPNASITAARPSTFFGKYLFDNYSDLEFASPDSAWTKRRKLAFQLIRSYGDGLFCIEYQIKKELRSVTEEIRNLDNKNVDPSDKAEEFTLNTLEVMIIGRSSGKNGELHKVLRKLDSLINATANQGIDVVYSFFPFLRFLPLRMSLMFKEVHKTKQRMLDNLELLSKEDTKVKGIYHSLIDVINQRDENGKQWFTEENLSNLLTNLVVAGFLTTRGTILSLIQLLAKRPDLQKALQKEIDRTVGPDREPCLADREKCYLTEAVVIETFRYISHVPLSLLHATSQPTTIGGYNIDKNTVIVPNLWTIHHSEKEWEEPFKFKPERFLDADGFLLPSNDPIKKRVIAFGIGKRSCIGEVFARSRIFLFLATLMQQATIVEPKGKSLEDLLPREMVPGISLQPKAYEVRFVLRSN
ncbi:cytochrome P450 1A1-like [Saccostrea echinata]|uniref:cytochrome P450 1A1-like n=1 Tax=Saccostrea echinata TaxID=191078 RepID=UPI002A83DA9A|nr:cytochrome P450 1A1-like [Saccostrea echinata]